MLMGVSIIILLYSSVGISAFLFRLILSNRISIKQAFTFISTAQALNKLIFTGSGYATMSFKLKEKNILLKESIAAFAILEFFSFLPWILLGIYSGMTMSFKFHGVFIVFGLLIIAGLVFKRKTMLSFFCTVRKSIDMIRGKMFFFLPLLAGNVLAGVLYYFSLFRLFSVRLPFFETIKISAVTLSVGYLSPVPSGLGVKESGLIFLLMQKGVLFKQACVIALADRLSQIIFYVILGLWSGGPIIMKTARSFFFARGKNKL